MEGDFIKGIFLKTTIIFIIKNLRNAYNSFMSLRMTEWKTQKSKWKNINTVK